MYSRYEFARAFRSRKSVLPSSTACGRSPFPRGKVSEKNGRSPFPKGKV